MFTKIDLTQAYQQLKLDPESQKYLDLRAYFNTLGYPMINKTLNQVIESMFGIVSQEVAGYLVWYRKKLERFHFESKCRWQIV